MSRYLKACLLALLLAAPARALCPATGGLDQTSESMLATRYQLASVPSPGTLSFDLASQDLLITEVNSSGERREFIEIYNPTPQSISLNTYYLTDYASEDGIGTRHGYWEIVTGAAFHVDNAGDYVARFPAGASIAPGQLLVIYTGASSPAASFVGGTADYEIVDASSTPNMQLVGGTPNGAISTGLILENAEFVMLFKWDGACDLVCDVDYLYWGLVPNGNSRVDKTNVVIDGPDADQTPGAYLPDIAANQQEATSAATALPVLRAAVGAEQTGGNGCTTNAVAVRPVSWGSIKALFRGPR